MPDCYNGDPSMALDAKGGVHLFFGLTMEYITNSSGSWMSTKIPSVPTSRCHDIAIDTKGGVHVAISKQKKGIVHFQRSGGMWTKSQVHTGGVMCNLSLASLGGGSVGIAFTTNHLAIPKLKFSVRQAGKWTTEEVAKYLNGPTLVAGKAGAPHIAAFDKGMAWVATKVGNKWKQSKIGATSTEPIAATDKAGNLHVILNGTSGATHVVPAAGGWQSVLVAKARATAMALDEKGKVHLALDPGPGSVVYPASSCGVCRANANCTGKNYWPTCERWPLRIYSNAAGAWISGMLLNDQCWYQCREYSKIAGYSNIKTKSNSMTLDIRRLAFHGKLLHVAFSRLAQERLGTAGKYSNHIFSVTGTITHQYEAYCR